MSYRRYQGSATNSIWVLIGMNLSVFIAVQFRWRLVYLLGLSPSTWRLAPWTLVTSLFVHSDAWHLLFNMLALYFSGGLLSGLVGEMWFLLVYFCGGIVGGLFYVLLGYVMLTSLYSVAIGASGAIFALLGAVVVIKPRLQVTFFPLPVTVPMWVGVLVGFAVVSIIPRVGWQAHLGGLIFGLIAGYFLRRTKRLGIV